MRNRPFRILLLTYVIGSIPGAIPATFTPFYTEYVLQVDEPTVWLQRFLLAYFLSGAACLAIWIPLARRFGKLRIWLVNFFIGITGGASLFFMGPGDEWLVLVLLIYTGTQFSAGFFLGPAMQADVIDYDELHTGKRREAQYGAFWAIATKLVVIPSAAVPLAFLGSIGYAPNQVQSPEVVLWMKSIYALGPAFFSAAAFFVARHYPISEEVHRRILEGIRAHDAGRSAVDPLTGDTLEPARGRAFNEELGWTLDHFSRGELDRFRAGGARALIGAVSAKCAAWAVGTGVACGLAAERILTVGNALSDLEKMGVTFVIVSGGALLSGLLFQLLKLARALRLREEPVPGEQIREHLAALS
jgi:GPH family glycoside/pentoside/hexuronide:cation symporter